MTAGLLADLLARPWPEGEYGRVSQRLGLIGLVSFFGGFIVLVTANQGPVPSKRVSWPGVFLSVGICMGVGLLGYGLCTVGGPVGGEARSAVGLIAMALAAMMLFVLTCVVLGCGLG